MALASLGVEVDESLEDAAPGRRRVDRYLVMGTAIGIKGSALAPERRPGSRSSRAGWQLSSRHRPVFVDGGIRADTVGPLAAAGAAGVIPGSLVFDAPDPVAAIDELHAQLRRSPCERSSTTLRAASPSGRSRRPRPGPGEVRVRVLQTGVCGTDLHLHDGRFLATYPMIPGHELVGVVDQIGPPAGERGRSTTGNGFTVGEAGHGQPQRELRSLRLLPGRAIPDVPRT